MLRIDFKPSFRDVKHDEVPILLGLEQYVFTILQFNLPLPKDISR